MRESARERKNMRVKYFHFGSDGPGTAMPQCKCMEMAVKWQAGSGSAVPGTPPERERERKREREREREKEREEIIPLSNIFFQLTNITFC